ncbi:kinesin-like protein KIN-10C isoform X2 [Momordica charantia]|uniref:Kinesin-like protein KIN-10C isoform X2 n=1 Tax=Momordica charantia TaxID=3673 RepID=A0A6J1E0Y3_MOMCH|nr:kinesin-like protein KIN-10C isoform X2 [Momordica charantia]
MASCTKDNLELRRAAKGFNEGRKVRVVAKIRSSDGGTTTSWISVNKPDGDASQSVTISFGDQPGTGSRKESYELDYCYEQNEDTEKIFAREVKSLIPGVFDGHNATVIAYGARGSAKTSMIQGTIEKPGLASLSINEFLLMALEKGKSISISYYEVYVDHVCDLLDPKRPTVLVLDDGQGKIQLKGLSQIPVKSLSDFYGLYFVGSSSRKQAQKIANEPPHRSHRGLIVHISSPDETTTDSRFAAKMNFVDMAGYEDTRRKSCDGTSLVENSKINKSIYALLNVASALNANDSHVPYRESKLTRILQDSLGGARSRILMITCLNATFCQDSIYMANLAARSCQVTKRVAPDANRKNRSLANTVIRSSSLRNQIPRTLIATIKKQPVSRFSFSEKKASSTASSAMKGRKLFDDDTSHLGKLDKEIQLSSASHRRVPLKHGESSSAVGQELLAVEISNALETTTVPEDSKRIDDNMKALSAAGDGPNIYDLPVESTPGVTNNTSVSVVKSSDLDKENNSYMINEDKSPPISARLRELSNTLRLISSSAPMCLKIPDSDAAPRSLVSTDVMEAQTPTIEWSRDYDEHDVADPTTPWETLSKRSTGVKNSLVDDYLRFLNTASKEELKRLKGIGEKRATSIIELREESPEPFKSLDDLTEIGLSAKQIKGLIKKEMGARLFN